MQLPSKPPVARAGEAGAPDFVLVTLRWLVDQASAPLYRGLALASGLAVSLVLARWWWTDSILYLFLGWNLLLAAVPLFFAEVAVRVRSSSLRYVAFAGWLLFFPNAPYLVTDLMHLHRGNAPLWYDLGLLSSFAVAGLLFAVASLIPVHRFFQGRFGPSVGWLTVFAACGLSGFGVYLGRFLRFNSWDVATRPGALAATLLHRVTDPFAHPRTWGVTILFGALMFVFYVAVAGSLNSTSRCPTTRAD